MSTRFDINDSKGVLDQHVNVHHCKTGDGCPDRLRLYREYLHVAELWGIEPGDDERQARQFRERVGTGAPAR